MFNIVLKCAVHMFFPDVCNLHKHSIFFCFPIGPLIRIFCRSKRKTSASQDAMTHSGYISALKLNILMKFLSHGVSCSQILPSRCAGTTTTVLKVMSPRGKSFLSSKEFASATIDSLLLWVQERFHGWKVADHNTSQELNYLQAKVGGTVTQ